MLFDSTLRKDLARGFGVTLIVILTIVLTIMLMRTVGQAAVGSIDPQDVVLMLGYTALGHLPTMLSLSLFIAVVATLSRMYRDSEMTVWFSSGVGLTRFVRPVLRMAWPVLLAVLVLELVVWPWGNSKSAHLIERYEKRADLSRVTPGQFQSSRDGSRVFFIERDTEDGRVGRNVFILAQQANSESVTTSKRGHLINIDGERALMLERGQSNEQNLKTGDKTVARFESYQVAIDQGALRSAEKPPPRALPTLDLVQDPNAANMGELTWRVGMILGGFNLTLLGIGLSATNPRRASNWNLLFALLSFVVYFNLINITQAWVANSRTHMPQALLIVHGSIFLLSIAILMWRDNAMRLLGMTLRRNEASA